MDAVEEVKARLNIEDVIGEYVQLKRAGRNWKGMSPFGNEKTPSFVVSPEKQIWHDFSSGKGGNMFSFVMEMEGLDFKAALELLARKAGIDLEQFRPARGQRSGPDKERLFELLETATHFYQVQFSKNQMALTYVFKQRLFSKATALEWRLGYSPNTGDALVKFLASKGFTPAEMKSAGVTAQRLQRPADMFRGRLMIPLQDPQGRVIGFTARLLEDNPEAPKYINTPQTPLYDKSRHVYGLHLAKESLRKKKYAVLAEGNLDVIASHQVGVREVVATAGTALTEYQLKALSRFTGDIRLAFDADKAGVNATERAIPIASKVGVSLSIIDIPSGKDPDELIKQDKAAWERVIQSPSYALDWLMDRYQKLLDVQSAQGKREYSDVLLPVIRELSDPVEKDHYLVAMADTIGVSMDALTTKLAQGKSAETRPLKRQKATPLPIDKQTVEDIRVQDRFLALMLLQPGLRESMQLIEPDMLFTPDARELLKFLRSHPEFDGKPADWQAMAKFTHGNAGQGAHEERPEPYGDTARTHRSAATPASISSAVEASGSAARRGSALRGLGDYVKIISLQYEELYHGLEFTELRYEAARLQSRLVERYVKHAKRIIAARLNEADEEATRPLLDEAKRLDVLLKDVSKVGI